MNDKMFYRTEWRIDKYSDARAHAEGRPYEVSEFEGNALERGIAEMLLLTARAARPSECQRLSRGGRLNHRCRCHADGLQAASNKFYNAMDAPTPNPPTGQQLVFRRLRVREANFAWNSSRCQRQPDAPEPQPCGPAGHEDLGQGDSTPRLPG